MNSLQEASPSNWQQETLGYLGDCTKKAVDYWTKSYSVTES